MAAVSRKKPDPLHIALKAGYEAYKADVAGNGEDSAHTLGEAFGRSRDWVYDVIKGATSFRFVDAPAWIRATGDYTALDWLCAQVGVIPVRVPECSGTGCTAATVRKFAGYLDGIAHAHEDNTVTRDEAAEIRALGESAVAAIYAEIAACEKAAGTYRVARLMDTG